MSTQSNPLEQFYYDNKAVRNFAIATIIWGVVGMLVGVIIATQLFAPSLNITQYGTFGRIRPLHTNAIIFAFYQNRRGSMPSFLLQIF